MEDRIFENLSDLLRETGKDGKKEL